MRLFRRYGWAFWVCAILLAGFLVSSVSSYLVSRESVRQTITESALPLTSDNIYSEIQRDLLRPVFISSMMANDTFLKDWVLNGEKDPEQVTKYLREIMQEYETVTSFFVSERTRNYYHADQLLKQVKEDEPRDVWYFRVRDMDPVYEINVDRDLANRDEMTVFINYKVFDHEGGSFLGATGVGLTVSRVHQLINSYEERYGRHILFVDSNGNVMLDTASNTGQAERNLRDFEGIGPCSDAILSSQVLETRYRKNGHNFFVNSRFVPELRWYLIVEQSEDLLLSPLRETLIKNIAIAVITTLIVSIICVTTIRRFQGRLERHNVELSRANHEVQAQKAEVQKFADSVDQKNTELAAMNREKDEFLGIVAHDLRSPINGITGLAEHVSYLLKDDRPDILPYMRIIQTSADSMLELIQTLMDVTLLENLSGNVEWETFDWNEVIRESVERFLSAAEAKQLSLSVALDSERKVMGKGRKDWFRICVNNLVSNAVKYSFSGRTIRLETRGGAQPMLRIHDGGPGFQPGDIDRMFGKFERLSAKPTAGESSTGLGLYIVSGMARRMDLEVKVSNHPDGGAEFVVFAT